VLEFGPESGGMRIWNIDVVHVDKSVVLKSMGMCLWRLALTSLPFLGRDGPLIFWSKEMKLERKANTKQSAPLSVSNHYPPAMNFMHVD
jgi:hypothetical protein